MFEGLFQPMHLIIVLGIVLLLFGPKKLPELGKGLGEAIRGFKQAFHEETEEPAKTESTNQSKSEGDSAAGFHSLPRQPRVESVARAETPGQVNAEQLPANASKRRRSHFV